MHPWGARAIEALPHEACRGDVLVVVGHATMIPPLATVVGVTFRPATV